MSEEESVERGKSRSKWWRKTSGIKLCLQVLLIGSTVIFIVLSIAVLCVGFWGMVQSDMELLRWFFMGMLLSVGLGVLVVIPTAFLYAWVYWQDIKRHV